MIYTFRFISTKIKSIGNSSDSGSSMVGYRGGDWIDLLPQRKAEGAKEAIAPKKKKSVVLMYTLLKILSVSQ